MRHRIWSWLPALAVMTWAGVGARVEAAPADTAPADVVAAIDAMEAASNQQDLEAVLQFYDESFRHQDGFDRSELEAVLKQFWQHYTALTYDIELVSWESTTSGYETETLTRVEGIQRRDGRQLTLTAEVRSRQRFEAGAIVYQEVLSEESRLTAGSNPPNLTLNLPQQVDLGERYEFDAIVAEPLGERDLLGRALDEGVTSDDFFKPRPLNLNVLAAGGLFKIGQAPSQPDERWISAVIVREDGLVITTRRLQVSDK
ncbi:uncharacterized protein XM38_032500 [Halomicronema hongdechloris C2206]|uniref:Nuclear transport factor 2 family protein n=1 Tax=Halomicronema hongdechloris C2206 TaxID=1641165 RepID=A0A1Z3HPQ9_9CYAN|nr:nuclear transport factor 2 family protein [Halomicronema hongdechloris]ASC72294.1 uncharacterized protein XM38_032500 [Halomicronema hongdechloris C2206]